MFAKHTEIIMSLSVITSVRIAHDNRILWTSVINGRADNRIFVQENKGEFTNEIHKVF